MDYDLIDQQEPTVDSPPEGITLNLNRDDVHVACRNCYGSQHSVFHCPRLPPNSLMVVEPILPEVFVLEGVLAHEHALNISDVRKAITEACHLLPGRMELTTKFLTVLDASLPLRRAVRRQPIEIHSPVLFAVMKKLLAAAKRELGRSENVVASLEASKRAISLLSQWQIQTRRQLVRTFQTSPEIAEAPTVKRVKLSLKNAVAELQSTLPELTKKPVDAQLKSSIQQGIQRLFPSFLLSISANTPPPKEVEIFDSAESLQPLQSQETFAYMPPILYGSNNQLSVDAPSYIPNTFHGETYVDPTLAMADGTTVMIPPKIYSDPHSQPDPGVPDLTKLFSVEPTLSYQQLHSQITETGSFSISWRNLSLWLAFPAKLMAQTRHPLVLQNGPAKKLIIEMARHYLSQSKAPDEDRSIAQYILIKFQIIVAMTCEYQSQFKLTDWTLIRKLVSTTDECDSPIMAIHRAALHNLVGLSLEVATPPNTYAEVSTMFERFYAMATYSMSLGLIDSGLKRLKDALITLDEAKRLATKLMVLKDLRRTRHGVARLPDNSKKPTCYDEYDDVVIVDQKIICRCIPFLFLKFLEIRKKTIAVRQPSWMTRPCELAATPCQSAFCLQHYRDFKIANADLYYTIDLFVHLTKLCQTSTTKDLDYATELEGALREFEPLALKLSKAQPSNRQERRFS